ncbi:uncharacterized protein G2W53_043496 [Senna tora]|uniref:Uncharacterized protein n=1 Tax=Senna tora TaxID=362788 RepID=A0A834SH49_9FABA|nr:uncharacterized protein G2W53_043496 [Senna tora]
MEEGENAKGSKLPSSSTAQPPYHLRRGWLREAEALHGRKRKRWRGFENEGWMRCYRYSLLGLLLPGLNGNKIMR